jgi:hypothetical protein
MSINRRGNKNCNFANGKLYSNDNDRTSIFSRLNESHKLENLKKKFCDIRDEALQRARPVFYHRTTPQPTKGQITEEHVL